MVYEYLNAPFCFKMFKHPAKACMTYFEHFKFSMFLSKEFGKATIGAFVHAIYPDILITHSRDTVFKLKDEFEKRGIKK